MPMPGRTWNAGWGETFCVCVCVLWLCIPASLKADTLVLNSGEVLQGQILTETDTQVVIEATFYHGTVLARRDVPKTDIKSITRESAEQKQEQVDYAALGKYTLNPNQELTKDEYAAGIAAFEKFLTTYPNSSSATDITQRVTEWRMDASNVASGKVKFASTWMSPAEKKVQAERWQKQADVEAAQNALQSLKKQLADLQTQRGMLAEGIAALRAKLSADQAKLGTGPGSGAGASSGGRRDLAGRLTAGVVASSQREANPEPISDAESSRIQSEITAYQQQIGQAQSTLGSLDTKIADIQSKIPQREQDSKLALARSTEATTPGGTGTVQHASAKSEADKDQPSTPKPEPTPPWYMRAWKWLHG